MTLAEFTALVRLYQACADPALREAARRLVPELAEWEVRGPVLVMHEPYTAEQRDRMKSVAKAPAGLVPK